MTLPTPSKEALAHQAKLLDWISQSIKNNYGALSFADFMQQALYAPGLGYYSAGSQKFGSEGDFITAPLISSLFSQCLAQQCAEILSELEEDKKIILELGAGNGQMAIDICHHLAYLNQLPSEYWILEVSADLKQKQQQHLKEALPDFYAQIKWLDKLPTKSFSGIILGNEVIDAMPVHLFQVQNENILEGFVIENNKNTNNRFELAFSAPQTRHLAETVQTLLQELPEPLPEGYTSEINLALTPWIKSLSDCLAKGVMLFVDYGFPEHEYYHPGRNEGTLMCHYRHHAHDNPFAHIGLEDITAHVDFTAVAKAATSADLDVLGFTHQAAFLMNNGLLDLAEKMHDKNPYKLSQEIQTLVQPHEMGELFKVIALGKDYNIALSGFQAFDNRHKL